MEIRRNFLKNVVRAVPPFDPGDKFLKIHPYKTVDGNGAVRHWSNFRTAAHTVVKGEGKTAIDDRGHQYGHAECEKLLSTPTYGTETALITAMQMVQ